MPRAPKRKVTSQEAQAALARARKRIHKINPHTGHNMRGPNLTLDMIVQALYKHNGLIKFSAQELKCSPLTIHAWLQANESLRDIQNQCRQDLVDEAEKALFHNVKRRKEPSVFFTLKCLAKNRGYIEQLKVSIDTVDSGTVKPSDETAAKVIEEL